jgi:hypothetical protein
MMAEITCPMCGKPNPADQAVCQYCEARLKPLTDELSRSQPPIRPGEEPTDVDTGQLEPILPQWLRDIRQQSRESADEDAEQPPAEEKADLLAGLQSQSEGDEEIPDWLAGLRSEGGQVDFEETSTDEDDLAALKSMLGEDTPVAQESEDSPLPSWVSDPGADEIEPADKDEISSFFGEGGTEEPAQTGLQTPASSPDLGWDADFGTDSAPQAGSTKDETSFDTELPAWLQDADQPPSDETDSGLPAWLNTEKPAPLSEGELTTPSGEGDLPDWLASLGEEETSETTPPQDTESAIKSTADWLTSLEEETIRTASPQEAAQPATEGELPDWLSSLGEESAEEIAPQEAEEPAATGDLPGWLATLGEESEEAPPQEQAQPSGEIEMPAWLSSRGEESATEEEQEISAETEAVEPSHGVTEGEIPDWLATMGEATGETEGLAEEFEAPKEEAGATPTFVDDEGQPISSEDVDAIFSMDMPDWLSDAEGMAERDATPAEPEAQADELRPADLPSWVQAMRPVESVISETEGTPPEEQPMEEQGPLAGLRGVLPAVTGVGLSSKPKAYSIKLLASEDQLSNAAMLEKMLAEEVTPKPVATQKVVLSQRILRWLIAALLILVVGATVYYSPQINPIPTSVPLETSAALNYIKNTLPANAPVLLVFDYEAARAGELEAAAAPMIDQMLTLKSPRLSLLSSTPTGSGLAERFMQILQADREYARNESFINLGYLPGGAAGVQAFSKNPVTTKQFTTTGEGAWTSPVLQGVSQLSNFAAIILLTDDVETARIWIEQTDSDRGEARLLVVSSAQSGPMIRPYVRSGQVDGMVTGLEDSAPIEQSNSGRPGMARRYWDAYGFGLLTAVVMITLGSLWSVVSSWQALRKEQGKG